MHAIVRPVSPSMERCELTHIARSCIDVTRAQAQHRGYVQTLQLLGCHIVELPAESEMPDAVFVEDTAVVLEEVAVLTRPGAKSRQSEVASIAKALAPFRPCFFIESPGTLDGGDLLRIGRELYVGRSERSNASGIAQLTRILQRFGYQVTPVTIRNCLHLKTAVTQVGPSTLLINDAWVDRKVWAGMNFVAVDPEEPFAANALFLAETVIHPASAVRTRDHLAASGIRVISVDISEFEKAEGGVTCCSVIFDALPALWRTTTMFGHE